MWSFNGAKQATAVCDIFCQLFYFSCKSSSLVSARLPEALSSILRDQDFDLFSFSLMKSNWDSQYPSLLYLLGEPVHQQPKSHLRLLCKGWHMNIHMKMTRGGSITYANVPRMAQSTNASSSLSPFLLSWYNSWSFLHRDAKKTCKHCVQQELLRPARSSEPKWPTALMLIQRRGVLFLILTTFKPSIHFIFIYFIFKHIKYLFCHELNYYAHVKSIWLHDKWGLIPLAFLGKPIKSTVKTKLL